jgi:hypothetical protein
VVGSSSLSLVREARLADLLGRPGRREASGVLVRDGLLLVVSDNTSRLTVLDDQLRVPGPHREVELVGGRGRQYEDLTADTATGRLFVLIESLPDGPSYRAYVEEYDAHYRLIASVPLDFPLEHPNKGIEGLSCVHRNGRTYLLGLCEGNRCRSGEAGREPGGGRIHVFAEGDRQWDRVDTIELPRDLQFRDYAGIALARDRVAVVSQESSALWVGRLDPASWSVDDGTVHEFPRDKHGRPRYAHVEGVSWLARDQVVVVSDRGRRSERHAEHDETVAVFALPTAGRGRTPPPRPAPPVRGLFQPQAAGDRALLQLARLRFAQAGMPAEVYAGSPEQLEDVLQLAPDDPVLPTVHLNRSIDIRTPAGQTIVRAFSERFAGRVAGFVVHDKAGMAAAVEEVVDAMRTFARADRPTVFLEYAVGMDPGQFLEIGERLCDIDGVGLCIDTGHVGVRRARARFAALHPDLRLGELGVDDPRLPDLADDVQDAVAAALPTVLALIRAAGALGRTVHHHLHDGHPILPGLPDHRSFLFRLPIPFRHEGRYSLDPMFGPAGLAQIVRTAVAAGIGQGPSLTLEIHQDQGRLPLDDAEPLFTHWRDRTNAERTNHLLATIAANHILATGASAPAEQHVGLSGAPARS